MRRKSLLAPLAMALLLAGASFAASAQSAGSEWSYFGGSKRFDRYSPLGQIDKGNVSRLQPLWTRPGLDASIKDAFPDLTPSGYLRGTPILINGVLYAPNAVGLVEAFDPATGATKWVQQPFANTLKEASGQSTRTVDYWEQGADKRIISVRGEYLYALDAGDGTPIASFGDQGRVSLNRNTPDEAPFFGFNGPIIVGDVIVIGGQGGGKAGGGYADGGDTKEARPEDIRGYDVRTGRQLWTFHILPRPGEPGYETWTPEAASYTGNMGAWAPLAADEELGIVYVPLSSPTNAFYGGHRPGNNLYANSLVALDARTGKLVWHFQLVHHDVWDSDVAAPPTLADLKVDGKRIPAVIQPGKTGFLYVFDRRNGEPVWPIEERPVPQSTTPGEQLSPTQPFPTKPPAFDRQGISEDELIDYTPELKEKAKALLAGFNHGPLFMPPSLDESANGGKKGTLLMPGGWGSGNWNTGAFDPETGRYYAVSMTLPAVLALTKVTDEGKDKIAYRVSRPPREIMSAYGPGPDGLPLLKGPYGRITAFDMNKGDKLWTVANGDGPRNHPLLKDLNLPPLGNIGRPVALVTKSLLFLGDASDALYGKAGLKENTWLRAYDKTTGDTLWQSPIPAGTTGGPITYMANGRQILLVPIGNNEWGSGWMAFGVK